MRWGNRSSHWMLTESPVTLEHAGSIPRVVSSPTWWESSTNTGGGFYGVEGYHNQILRGVDGKKTVEKGPTGNELPHPPVEEIPSEAGTSLVLTVDRNIQWIAQEELRNALKEYDAESGTVLIMDPQTGAILADVSYPSFDPNDFVHADPDLLADPAVSDMWEPGSIFKIITWAAALDAGTISPGTTFYDEGALEVGGRSSATGTGRETAW